MEKYKWINVCGNDSPASNSGKDINGLTYFYKNITRDTLDGVYNYQAICVPTNEWNLINNLTKETDFANTIKASETNINNSFKELEVSVIEAYEEAIGFTVPEIPEEHLDGYVPPETGGIEYDNISVIYGDMCIKRKRNKKQIPESKISGVTNYLLMQGYRFDSDGWAVRIG